MLIVQKHLQAVTRALTGKDVASIGELLDKINLLQTELAKHRWIPVGERLPENEAQVWVCYKGTGYTYVAYYVIQYKRWYLFNLSGGDTKAECNPTHWKPIILPE